MPKRSKHHFDIGHYADLLNFLQGGIMIPRAFSRKPTNLTHSEYSVLMYITTEASMWKGRCYKTQEEIGVYNGMSESAVKNAIRTLRRLKYILVKSTKVEREKTVNTYIVNGVISSRTKLLEEEKVNFKGILSGEPPDLISDKILLQFKKETDAICSIFNLKSYKDLISYKGSFLKIFETFGNIEFNQGYSIDAATQATGSIDCPSPKSDPGNLLTPSHTTEGQSINQVNTLNEENNTLTEKNNRMNEEINVLCDKANTLTPVVVHKTVVHNNNSSTQDVVVHKEEVNKNNTYIILQSEKYRLREYIGIEVFDKMMMKAYQLFDKVFESGQEETELNFSFGRMTLFNFFCALYELEGNRFVKTVPRIKEFFDKEGLKEISLSWQDEKWWVNGIGKYVFFKDEGIDY